jgi:hypothetical protein
MHNTNVYKFADFVGLYIFQYSTAFHTQILLNLGCSLTLLKWIVWNNFEFLNFVKLSGGNIDYRQLIDLPYLLQFHTLLFLSSSYIVHFAFD